MVLSLREQYGNRVRPRTYGPRRKRFPLIEDESPTFSSTVSDIGSQIVEGNPAIRAITDTIRDIYRNYDVELEGGILPQIVPSDDNPASYGLLSFGEGDQTAWDDTYSFPEAPVPSGYIPMDTTQTPGTPDTTYYGETPARELQRNIVTDEFEPVFDPGMVDYYEGEVPQGIIRRAPYVTGRGFKTEGKVKEEAEEKEAARIWGNFAYDPAEAQKRYEDAMQDIYFKSTILDGIAALTGGKSQASSFVEIATKRMEMEEAFRDQTRLQNIQRGIYYTQDGVYDPPKNKQEAFDRAMKFGASADLASKVSGYAPEEDTRAWHNWYRIVDGELEETVSRTGDKPEGEGWKKGTYSAPSSSGGTETERTLNMIDSLVSQGNVKAAIEELKRIFTYKTAGDITSNEKVRIRDAVEIVWNSINPSLKIAVPAEVDSVDKLQKWEDELKASGVRGYYRVGNDIGIIE